MQFGYLLHPSIPLTEGMKIADMGAGTGCEESDFLTWRTLYPNLPNWTDSIFLTSNSLPKNTCQTTSTCAYSTRWLIMSLTICRASTTWSTFVSSPSSFKITMCSR
ncbi:hypothetical protein VTN77DRAFT_6384 [Rasamsonia byssochlamydoides]|uniref:uncharacterized protein n=1 Tax=Rasamsonia byssochlamydoides TaxID=89139 RepID=UPI00374304F9